MAVVIICWNVYTSGIMMAFARKLVLLVMPKTRLIYSNRTVKHSIKAVRLLYVALIEQSYTVDKHIFKNNCMNIP